MVSSVDIRSDHLKIVQDILCTHLPSDVKVWVFGSRATWTTKDSSDLDLAVEGDTPLDFRTINILQDAFEDSSLPYTVDVVDMNRVSGGFRQVIEEHKTLFPVPESSSDWCEVPFSQAVEVNPKVQLVRGETYPFVGMAAINGDSRNTYAIEEREFRGGGSRFLDGDTLMARITPCLENGKIARYNATKQMISAHGSTEFIVIRGRPDVTDGGFAYYLTRWNRFREYAIGQMTGTSGRQRVPAEALDHIAISLPPLSEQRAIAHILGTLDDKIELNQKTNKTLEEIAKAIFKSWFVDFDPVRAKAEGHPTGLPSEISDLFPDTLVESEIGEIPKGWSIASIYDLCEVIYGAPFKSKLFNSDRRGLPLVRIRDLAKGGSEVFTEEAHPKGTLIKAGDLVVGMDGEFRCYYWTGKDSWMNQRICKFIPNTNIPTAFLKFGLERPLYEVESTETATTVIHLGKSDIDRFKLIRPSDYVMSIYEEISFPIFAKIKIASQENDCLSQLRDILLPRLISGELHISDAEKFLEEVDI